MKLRLLNLAALSAVAFGAPAFAQQQDESLERALADLNSGVIAPQGGGVTAGSSDSLTFSGDARIRNNWINPSGAPSDRQNIDARARVNMAFNVTANSEAFVQLLGTEIFGGPASPTGLRPQFFQLDYATADSTMSQAWFSATDVFGDGGTFKFGRSNYDFASSRILGTDNWDNFPQSYTGAWYTNPLEGWNLDAFMIADASAGGANGLFTVDGDDSDLYGVTADWSTDEIDFLDNLEVRPYLMRFSDRVGGFYINWYGAQVETEIDIVDVELELVFADTNLVIPEDSNTGYYLEAEVDLSDVLEIEGVDPAVEIGFAGASESIATGGFGITVSPEYHDTAGLADVHGFAGVWSGFADTIWFGVDVVPAEDWEGEITYLIFDDNTMTGIFDANELDAQVSHHIDSVGADVYAGWAWVDFDNLPADAYVIYLTIGLPF